MNRRYIWVDGLDFGDWEWEVGRWEVGGGRWEVGGGRWDKEGVVWARVLRGTLYELCKNPVGMEWNEYRMGIVN
jgi:hypothetical protein